MALGYPPSRRPKSPMLCDMSEGKFSRDNFHLGTYKYLVRTRLKPSFGPLPFEELCMFWSAIDCMIVPFRYSRSNAYGQGQTSKRTHDCSSGSELDQISARQKRETVVELIVIFRGIGITDSAKIDSAWVYE